MMRFAIDDVKIILLYRLKNQNIHALLRKDWKWAYIMHLICKLICNLWFIIYF